MKPVSFLEITIVGDARKPRLTPATRERLQDRGISFFSIVNEEPGFVGRNEVRLPLKQHLDAPRKSGLDNLFEKTVEGFHKNLDSVAEYPQNRPIESSFGLSSNIEKEPIGSSAMKFHKLEDLSETESTPSEDLENHIAPCVMVVEDDSVIAGFLVHMLTRRGFDVRLAEDGRQAAKMLEETDPPKLVILDIVLPFIDGFELIKKIRAKTHWKEVPIMMLTSKTQERDIVRAFDYGANEYIFKPFQSQELIARVDRFMR